MRSPPALAAAYGELGASGASSDHEPRATLPYTSSVETWTTRRTPASRHACSRTWTPTTLAATKSGAPTMDRSTWVSAAKLITMSWSRATAPTSAASQMSPRMNVNRGWLATACRLARLPA